MIHRIIALSREVQGGGDLQVAVPTSLKSEDILSDYFLADLEVDPAQYKNIVVDLVLIDDINTHPYNVGFDNVTTVVFTKKSLLSRRLVKREDLKTLGFRRVVVGNYYVFTKNQELAQELKRVA